MTTNKTFLILLLAGFSYTAYNAAAVSENFEISTTIDHEITLGSFRAASADADINTTSDINMGTIYINPNATGRTYWYYHEDGVCYSYDGDAVVRADNETVGYFTANIPHPGACNTGNWSCGGLSVTGTRLGAIDNIFGGSNSDNDCSFVIKYTGRENDFKLFALACYIGAGKISSITSGLHEGTLTISYNPE
ncbi:MAG: hypothetical protein IJ689_05225 [Alphaproteobacteria bacterium]|nr:hypothetical protein [Alphaproteobacteria bacterium]